MEIGLIEKAVRIATRAHNGQMRKETDLPYVMHPFMVAFKLSKYGFSDEVVAAALVHDVIEDTSFAKEDLIQELGDKVWNIVEAVTNDDTLPWEEKKLKYINSVRNAGDEAKAVATVDKIHNLESLLIAFEKYGDEVWSHFNRGMEKKIWFEESMLKMLKDSWKHPMIEEYDRLLNVLKEKIKSRNI